jgi:hypothetical protein
MAWCLWPPTRGPLAPRQGRYSVGWGLEPGRFPEQAVDFIAQVPELGNLYNNVAFGGYLLWRLFPPRQIFNDGRNELNPDFLRELATARQDSQTWNGLLDRYEIDGALVRYDRRRRPVLEPPIVDGGEPQVVHLTSNTILFTPDRFALAHWDDVAMVFVQRDHAPPEWLARHEYRVIRPDDLEHLQWQLRQDPGLWEQAESEARRAVASGPDTRRAEAIADVLAEGPGLPTDP